MIMAQGARSLFKTAAPKRSPGANLGATAADDFPRQADEHGQAAGDHARSRTDPNNSERMTGIYGSDASGGGTPAPG